MKRFLGANGALAFMPVVINPPPAHYQVGDGYAAAQACATVAEPGAYAGCVSIVSMPYEGAGDRNNAFYLGFMIAILARMDQMEQQFHAAPPSPTRDHDVTEVDHVALASRLAVEKTARKEGVAKAALPMLIYRISGMAPERWSYWRAQPVPDWIAKTAAANDPGRPKAPPP